MKLIPLPLETQVRTGKSHKLIIDYRDLNGTSATLMQGQSQTFAAAWTTATAQAVIPPNALGASSVTVPAGTQVVGTTLVNVTTAFVGPSTTVLTLSLGDGGSTTRFVSAIDLLTAGYKTSAVANYTYIAADTIDAIATITGGTMGGLTAGEVEILVNILPGADLTGVR